MRAVLSFACAAIYAGGMAAPTEVVTGRVLFGTVLAGIWGYAIGSVILDFRNGNKNGNKKAAATPKE